MEKSRVTMKQITAGIAGVIVLTVIDQLTKLWAIAELKGQPSIIWIKGIFELQYLENRGAAFGLMQNQQWLFLICVAVVLGAAGKRAVSAFAADCRIYQRRCNRKCD